MGKRKKMIYKDSRLIDALSGQVLNQWNTVSEEIFPSAYCVRLTCANGEVVRIFENEKGIYLEESGETRVLSESSLSLPSFSGYRHADLLKILHQEVLVNVVDGKPVPNFFVYGKPWLRDSAMMCMVLEHTGNLHLVKDWILSLTEPFDRNNAGIAEPDNLGETLFLVSLVSDLHHPVVATVLERAREFEKEDFIIGLSDFAEHPVYQTKWMKYGLKKLGLPDKYAIPKIYDSYSSLFWMDYRGEHVDGPLFDEVTSSLYPYLGWAEAHSLGGTPPELPDRKSYPLTWEAEASQANYEALKPFLPEYAQRKISAPHTWHASEMFLYLLNEKE